MVHDYRVVLDPLWEPLLIQADGCIVRPRHHVFAGGEVHVQFPSLPPEGTRALLAHRVNSANDLIALLLAVDVIRAERPQLELDLFLPYVPYARQDRRMIPGDPLSIRVLANLVNGCGFSQVFVLDPHSDVTTAVIDRCRVLPVHDYVALAIEQSNATRIIIPDAGAAKRVHGVLRVLGPRFPDLVPVQAMKTRDLADSGRITEMHLDTASRVAGQACLIVDDICDGGRTFLELAKILRQNGAASVHLYVTHGIFTHGLDAILACRESEGRIDQVFATDSILSRSPHQGFVEFRT